MCPYPPSVAPPDVATVMHYSQSGEIRRTCRLSKHTPSLSRETNVSGIADSTTSYGESLRLSQFPNPPASIPTTPIVSEFGIPSSNHKTFNFRTTSRFPESKQHPQQNLYVGPSASNIYPYAHVRTESPVHSANLQSTACHQSKDSYPFPPSTAHTLSPYDWHDGASSIAIDDTEDQLLSTSFITSLLQENVGPHANRRTSTSSDALSGFSEMTYPPLASSFSSDKTSPRYLSPMRSVPQRLQGGRPPPTAFVPISESPDRSSGDSDTMYTRVDHHSSVFRKASLSQSNIQSASVLGLASATLHTVDNKGRSPLYHSPTNIHSTVKRNDSSADHYNLSMTDSPASNRTSQPTQRRASIHSTKSSRNSFISRISSYHSIRRVLTSRRVKPLPPVPTMSNVPITAENEQRRVDASRPPPELLNRAGTLQVLLEKGYHPHQSLNSHYEPPKGEDLISAFDHGDTVNRETDRARVSKFNRKPLQDLINQLSHVPESYRLTKSLTSRRKKWIFIILGIFLVVVLAAVGTAVGLSVHGRKNSYPVCSGNFVGAACDLDATCVCTSSDRCDGLAQNLVDLIPALNQFAQASFTSSMVYKSIWLAQGAVPGNNCASQSRLVDVAPALNFQSFPEHATWAQTILLWNLVESQDIPAVNELQKFIQEAPWKNYDHADATAFTTTVSGYTFDFASRNVTQPSRSFVDQGQPTSAQASQVGPVAQPALDRMYSFAVASSTQHKQALLNYWTTVLKRRPADLSNFMAALSVSPILLPFDAISQGPGSPSNLQKDHPTSSFPPPPACYPGLSSVEKYRLDVFESQVFGLPPMRVTNGFEASCFPDRPIYGILNVLRQRLPFNDTGPDSARQAVVLRRDTSPRVLVRGGEVFSALPGLSNTTTPTATQLDPRQYGTLGQYNHVVLNYLSSIPDISVVTALVDYVLDSVIHLATPPNGSSILFHSFASIPVLEVAVFGSIGPSDIASTVSAFTTPSGTLFFGSDQADTLRSWTISDRSSTIAWAESAFSPLIVRDKDFLDKAFNDTWNAVSLALHHNIDVSLLNVTTAFQDTQRFTTS